MNRGAFPSLRGKPPAVEEMVGAPRFELGTSWSRTKRATRLRYAPAFICVCPKAYAELTSLATAKFKTKRSTEPESGV
jgi:hypothetical protein